MDSGIIKAFKGNYRKLLARKFISAVEENRVLDQNLYHALDFVAKSWGKITQSTIANCFRHAGFTADGQVGVDVPSIQADDVFIVENSGSVFGTEESFEDYINVDDYVITRVSDDIVSGTEEPDFEASELYIESEDEDNVMEVPTINECYSMISKLEYFFRCNDDYASVGLQAVKQVEENIRKVEVSKKRQSVMFDFFPMI